MSPSAWQSTANARSFLSALTATALYENIGIKVLYQT